MVRKQRGGMNHHLQAQLVFAIQGYQAIPAAWRDPNLLSTAIQFLQNNSNSTGAINALINMMHQDIQAYHASAHPPPPVRNVSQTRPRPPKRSA